jgi:N-acetylmuramoyl-L-alanine amidase
MKNILLHTNCRLSSFWGFRLLHFAFFFLLFGLLPAGCASNKLALRAWKDLPKKNYTIPPYASYLASLKIALDPGHGGLSHLPGYKRGPTGKEESVMNLSVARLLREFLELAGAKVVMTRTDDRFVSLQERADIAARAGCDFMISLHHNAGANPKANYAAVFYHSHPDYSPVSMDLARHVYFGIVEALRLPQMSPEGLLSDKLIYPAGFGLLRASRVPAILLESSFYSNPAEEKRLMKTDYNRREAYGIFLGLARWAAGGLPGATMIQPADVVREKTPQIVYAISDGVSPRARRPNSQLLIYSSSVTMRVDGEVVPARLELAQKRLFYQPALPLKNGPHLVQVEVQNLFKNHSLPRTDTLVVASPAADIQFAAPSVRLPGDGLALMPVEVILRDADGEPVWEGTDIKMFAERGRISLAPAPLKNGCAQAYFQAAADTGTARLIAEADGRRDTLLLALVPPGEMRVLSGIVSNDSTGVRLASAQIIIDDSLATVTDGNGSFFEPALAAGEHRLEVRARGYATDRRTLFMKADQSQIVNARLQPHCHGVLHDQTIILDAALGGAEAGDRFIPDLTAAQASLQLAKLLGDSLRWGGAEVVLIRMHDSTMALPARIGKINQMPKGWYLKLGYRRWNSDSLLVQCTNYPGNQAGQRLAGAILAAFAKLPRTRVSLQQNTSVPEVTMTNKMAVEVIIACREPAIATRDLRVLFNGIVQFQHEELHRTEGEDPAAQ